MQLIWFRQDLRIQDHTALWHATQAGPCIGVVILSPEQWRIHHDAPIKIDFYLRQLNQLKQALKQINIPLIIQRVDLWHDIPSALLKICDHYNIECIHANIELGVNELKRDNAVQKCIETVRKNCSRATTFELYHDRTLFPVTSIRNQSNLPYQVFSAFKKNCYEKLIIALPQCYPCPEPQHSISDIAYANIEVENNVPSVVEFFPDFKQPNESWTVGEPYAHSLLNDFIEQHLPLYKIERDFPSLNTTSRLSAYLNIGILSIRQCIQALFSAQQGHFQIEHDAQQTWLDELLWREFYQHILFDFPQVSKHLPFKKSTLQIQWLDSPEQFFAWQHGRTGIPIVDAGMRQMLTTGWMHNRVRMIVAMFLTKNLLIDWRKGEQWFMQHLIDGDLAANNGGWQWCASTGTDSAPYFRIFNPINQSQKFDANGDYIRQWLPELAHLDAKTIHAPYAKNPDLILDYPKPIVDLKQSRIRAIEAFKQLSSY